MVVVLTSVVSVLFSYDDFSPRLFLQLVDIIPQTMLVFTVLVNDPKGET